MSAPARTAKGGNEGDAEMHGRASSPQVRSAADRQEDAPERVDSVPLTLEPAGYPAAETERLERLHERLVSEHVRSTDELVAYRRQFTERAEEQGRLQQSISALEARLEDGELMLSLITAKLRGLTRP
jgi:hypothetical protein